MTDPKAWLAEKCSTDDTRDPRRGVDPVPVKRNLGPDFRKLVADKLRETGGTLEDALVQVFVHLMAASAMGDVGASKLLLDRLAMRDDAQDFVTHLHLLTDIERAARIQAILDAAARRKAAQTAPKITAEPTP